MKIFHLPHCYWPAEGRVEKLAKEISERLARRGHQVEIYTSCGLKLGPQASIQPPYLAPGESLIGGIKVKRYALHPPVRWTKQLGRWAGFIPWLGDYLTLYLHGPLLPQMVAELKKEKPDIIAAAAFPMYNMWLAWRLAQQARRPLVYLPFYHPDHPRLYRRPLWHWLLKQAEAVMVGSGREKEALLLRGVPASKIHWLGYGVTVNEPQASPDVPWRQRLKIRPEAEVVLFTGRQVPPSGVFTLLRAAPLVWQHHPQTCFILAGSPTSCQDKIRQKIAELGERQNQVILLKAVNVQEKISLYGLADVFTSPGCEDYLPVGLLEAWLAGRPVVAAREGAAGEVVAEDKDGLRAAFGSAIDLACAIAKLLRNPAQRAELGQRGREKVLKFFSWEAAADRLEKVYQRIADKEGPKND